MEPGAPVLRSTRLLDQVHERTRYLHYSLSTEKAYLYWIRFCIRWHGPAQGMRHPRDMGAPKVEAFLTMLATDRKASASTHNKALSALLFLYRKVLGVNLQWLNGVGRPTQLHRPYRNAAISPNPSRTRANTGPHSRSCPCRHRRAEAYQGESSRSRIQQ